MLFVDLEEQSRSAKSDFQSQLNKTLTAGLERRMKDASLFVLDQNATAMCVNVFFSRPSSILQALQFARLQAPSVWIEYSNLSAREAFARMGNENTWKEGGVLIERTGMLLTQTDELTEMETMAQFRRADGSRVIELMTSFCTFDTSPDFRLDPETLEGRRRIEHSSTGQAKRYYDLLSRDDREYLASQEIRQRFHGALHPDYADALLGMEDHGMREHLARTLEGHIQDCFNMFKTQILPSLILINCRNAVEPELVPAPEKLNKTRRAKGRPVIPAYRLIKLKLRPRQVARSERRGQSGVQMAGGLVIGHFKVRKTGVFWWSPFFRGKVSGTAPRTVRIVTP